MELAKVILKYHKAIEERFASFAPPLYFLRFTSSLGSEIRSKFMACMKFCSIDKLLDDFLPFYHDLRTLIRLYRGTYINFSVISNDPITPSNMKW